MQAESAAGSRYERELQELIEGKSWKQAHALCEKRIRNGEKDDKLWVGFTNVRRKYY